MIHNDKSFYAHKNSTLMRVVAVALWSWHALLMDLVNGGGPHTNTPTVCPG